jgi:hypothetical protein
MQPPRGVHNDLWRVVCLAAVEAMLKGKHWMGAWETREREEQIDSPGVEVAARKVVARFWELLDDFASAPWVVRVGKKRRLDLPAGHPFFRGNEEELRVYRPGL